MTTVNTTRRRLDRDQVETRVLRVLRWLTIAGFLLVTLLPFYYMLTLSVRPIERVLLDPGSLWVPLEQLTTSTYAEVLKSVESGGQGFLSFIVSVSAALLSLAVSIPGDFETIPVSLEESAAIHGAGRYGIIRRISLPLAAPSIMAVALYDFMIAWSEFLFALLFLVDRPNRWTVSLGLSQLADGVEVPKTVLMAGLVILTLPIVILFFASERLLTEGLTAGAEKG
ncbi:MAG TPA: carbohydrate ABC transporter permease [Micromonosporaceae bacterium]|nr:carbohydrate ABC transporter permease [Micromonosporaceae bacterium]